MPLGDKARYYIAAVMQASPDITCLQDEKPMSRHIHKRNLAMAESSLLTTAILG